MTSPIVETLHPTIGRPVLALASNNRGKIAEFRTLLGDDVEILSMADLGLDSPEESGTTFEANALLKARFVFNHTGRVTLADDSGLEVDALDGAPGVYSARYAGDHHDDADNRSLLVRNLGHVPRGARMARFVAAVAIIDRNGNESVYRGTCEGSIAFVERGTEGFGYDSLFELADGRTMAELGPLEKNSISHRAHALRNADAGLRLALGVQNKRRVPS
jgi:XTP/dITP diphosphohydrolase